MSSKNGKNKVPSSSKTLEENTDAIETGNTGSPTKGKTDPNIKPKNEADPGCSFCKRQRDQIENVHNDLVTAKNKNTTLTIWLGVGIGVLSLVLLGSAVMLGFVSGVCKKKPEQLPNTNYINTGTFLPNTSSPSLSAGSPGVLPSYNPNAIVSSSQF